MSDDLTGYKSPINIIVSDIQSDLFKEEMPAVRIDVRDVGIDIDKEELIKALQYDRNQYEKGKTDGIKEFLQRLSERDINTYIERNLLRISGIRWSDIWFVLKEMGVELDETD